MPNHITNIMMVTGSPAELARFRLAVSSKNPDLIARKQVELEATVEFLKKKIEANPEDGIAKSDLKNLLEKDADPDVEIDFNGTVPMPIEIKTTTSSSSLSDWEKKHQQDNVKKYGVADWYGWSNKYWGTKWGAYDEEEVEEIPSGLVYRYNTAWSPAVPWLVETSRLFPDLSIVDAWKDEGGGSGKIVVEKGVLITDENMEDHDWYIEFEPDYKEEYDYITGGDYNEVLEKYSGENGDDFFYYPLKEHFLKRVSDKDLPLFVNFDWGGWQEEFEKRLKGLK